MRLITLICGIIPLLLTVSQVFATNVDLVLSKTAQDTQGNGDGGFVRTRGTLSASANLYRSDDRSPLIRTRAWLWTFPEELDPKTDLVIVHEGDAPHTWVYTWQHEQQREQLIEQSADLQREFQTAASAPGVLSRWTSTPDREWRMAVEPVLRMDLITVNLRLERTRHEEDAVRTTSVRLPVLSMPAGETRIVPVVLTEMLEAQAPPIYLELHASYDWGAMPPRVRQRDYTGSWLDRVDVGGQLKVEGVYTENVFY